MCEKIWSVGCGLVFLDPISNPFPSQLPLIEVSVSCNSGVLTAPGEEVTRAQKTLMRSLPPPPPRLLRCQLHLLPHRCLTLSQGVLGPAAQRNDFRPSGIRLWAGAPAAAVFQMPPLHRIPHCLHRASTGQPGWDPLPWGREVHRAPESGVPTPLR